ncbi:unnamed protein product [Ophioblennius macclurei]
MDGGVHRGAGVMVKIPTGRWGMGRCQR